MKGILARIGVLVVLLGFSCGASQAVTFFDSNVRPDGVGDTSDNNNAVYVVPSNEEGNVYASAGNSGTVVTENTEYIDAGGDAFDSAE